jgi:hypothetical protein
VCAALDRPRRSLLVCGAPAIEPRRCAPRSTALAADSANFVVVGGAPDGGIIPGF